MTRLAPLLARGLAACWAALAALVGVADTLYYFATNGANDLNRGMAFDDPIAFTVTNFQKAIVVNPRGGTNPTVDVRIRLGTYVAAPIYFGSYSEGGQTTLLPTSRRLIIRRAPEESSGKPVLVLSGANGVAGGQTCLLGNQLSGPSAPIAYFRLEDVVLDCNWSQQGTGASPSWSLGYRTRALSVIADAGLVRRVRVRNFGANGVVPRPWANPARVEAFPFWVEMNTYEAAYSSSDKDPDTGAAWLIDDCELSDFHSLHDGYCTAILTAAKYPTNYNIMSSNSWSAYLQSNRLMQVRRCQVRGATIATGMALGMGVNFSDNVIVGCTFGYNTDTGWSHHYEVANNVFLDVVRGGNIGGMGYGPEYYVNHRFTENFVRLAGCTLAQDYGNFSLTYVPVTNYYQWFTDTARVLGRYRVNACAGFEMNGGGPATAPIVVSSNRFTTRHRDTFYEPNPGADQAFTTLWRPTNSLAEYMSSGPGPANNQSGSATITGNVLSQVAFDMGQTTVQADGYATNAAGFQYHAATAMPAGFIATRLGNPGRVELKLLPDGSLDGVYEVQMDEPTLTTNGVLTVHARWVLHYTGRSAAVASEPQDPTPLQFAIAAGPRFGAPGTTVVDQQTHVATWTSAAGLGSGLVELYRAS